ncbi:MAG: hypothetical protein HC808_20325 [Candidatus Competibacteraceae bacterium]|nr:hypothetical protein [Candidatus Competibacteraceae bacterium]
MAGSPAPAGSDTASASPAPQQVAAVTAPSGEAIYSQACAACHAAGVLQAPKLGSKEQWEPRFAQGLDTLVHNATNGIRAMPAKGGHPNLTEDDIRSSVVYMLKESGIEVAEATTQVAEVSPSTATEPATPAQEATPVDTTPTQPVVTAAPPATAPPPPVVNQSVSEVTLAAAEAANAASQAAAAASQAAAAASQAAAAASQAAAAVSQAIDMVREIASDQTVPQVKSTLSGPAEKAEPASVPSAPAPQPTDDTSKPTAPVVEKAAEEATAIPRTLSGPPANAPAKPAPSANSEPVVPTSVEKTAPTTEEQVIATTPEAAPTAPATEPATATTQEPVTTAPPSTEVEGAVEVVVPADIQLARGKQLYSTACVICHQAGVAGAPKLGDKAAWAPRLTQGFDTLVDHSIKGYKGMPPKGGRLDIPNREIRSAVGYMLSELE